MSRLAPRVSKWRFAPLVCVFASLAAMPAAAQSGGTAADSPAASRAATPVSPPASPTLTRDAEGHITVHATRVRQPIKIDGRLDDETYLSVSPITEFIQQEPQSGVPISERTELWVLFDDTNIYVSARCWDEHPERIVANDMRRDVNNLTQQDNVAVAIDTFHDGRNAFIFVMTPAGGMRDGYTTDESPNFDWNGVWDGRSIRDEHGWMVEMALPFKTLRYTPGTDQTWGIQIRRRMSGKNELAFLTLVSPRWSTGAINHASVFATLVGIEAPAPALNLDVKPYGITRVTTDLLSNPAVRNNVDPTGGLDLKYGLTKSLTADFTLNTDFAQVEADEAQINLTRFNLSFPEKREFFLEGRGIFDSFGASPNTGGGFATGGPGGTNVAPTIFYSRSIGLAGGREVPVIGGGRLSGKAGPWSVGALNMETGDERTAGARQTNFSVLRLRRNILRRSNVGGIFTRRSLSTVAPGSNEVWGLDANLAFYQNVYLVGYLAQSRTGGRSGDDMAYRTQFAYGGDRYGLTLDRNVVEKNFNPEVGFMRRLNFRRTFAQPRFSPRTTNSRLVRKFTYQADLEYITDNQNHLESRTLNPFFQIDFQNSDFLAIDYARNYEFLPLPFQIASGVQIPAGGYSFGSLTTAYTAGSQHRVSGKASFETGSFYDGDKQTATFSGRVTMTPQLAVEPNISLNWIDVPQGKFTTTLVGGRTTFTMTPRMFVAALVQYSSSNTSLSTNLRLRWEYQPGSELFVVYTEGRSTLPPSGTELQSCGVVVKINRLFRF